MRKILSVVVLFCFMAVNAQTSISDVVTLKDLTYKKADTAQHKLDIYLPQKSEKKSPVLIFVHGGGWVGGSKSFPEGYYMNDFILKFVQEGYAVVSITYTLLNDKTHFPAPVEDCKEAIRWIRANSVKYNFDDSNIGLWGASAGAHIGMLAAFSDEDQFSGNSNFPNYSAKVNYVIDYFGPADLNGLFRTETAGFKIFLFKLFFPKIYKMRNNMIFGFTALDIKKDKKEAISRLKLYSPVSYVNKNTVPTLIIHGTKDKIVPFKESEHLKEILDENKIENELVPIKDGDHGLHNASGHALMLQKTVDFAKAHTKQ